MNDLIVRIGLEDDLSSEIARVRREVTEELKKLAPSVAEQDATFDKFSKTILGAQKKEMMAVKKANQVWREKTRVLLPVMFFANKMSKSFGWLQENIKKTYHAGELFSIQQMIMSDYMDTWLGQLQTDTLVWFADFLADHPNMSALTGAIVTVGGWTAKVVDFAASIALIKFSVLASSLATVGTTAETVATSVAGIGTQATVVKTALAALVSSPFLVTIAITAASIAGLLFIEKLLAKITGEEPVSQQDLGTWQSTVGAALGTSMFNIFDPESGEMRMMTVNEILELQETLKHVKDVAEDLVEQGIDTEARVSAPAIITPQEIVDAFEASKNEAGEVVIDAPTASEAEDIRNTLELLGYSNISNPYTGGLYLPTNMPFAQPMNATNSTSSSYTYNYNMTSQPNTSINWTGTTSWGDYLSDRW